MLAASSAMVFMTSGPALAVDDSMNIASLYDGCARTDFIDYGTYANGASRDDFFTIRDLCADGYSAFAIVKVNGQTKAEVRNSDGAGSKVYFDILDNLVGGQNLEIYACLKNGANGNAFYCDRNYQFPLADG
jgi:hypothetical protein